MRRRPQVYFYDHGLARLIADAGEIYNPPRRSAWWQALGAFVAFGISSAFWWLCIEGYVIAARWYR